MWKYSDVHDDGWENWEEGGGGWDQVCVRGVHTDCKSAENCILDMFISPIPRWRECNFDYFLFSVN